MVFAIAAFEVMDKEPPVWLIFLCFFALGVVGMLLARHRPILCAPLIALVLLGAFALYLEFSEPYVGDAILREGGFIYISVCGLAIVAGIIMPLIGALVGTKNLEKSLAAWRWTLGVSGAVLLGLTVFAASGFVRVAYYNYIFLPKEKAEEHYIMPLRWQDIVAEISIACVLISLLLLSTYLLLSALRNQKPPQPLVNS